MLELSHLSSANVTKPSPGFGAKSGCHSPPHSACEAVAFHDRSLGGVGMIPRVRMVASSAKKVSTLRLAPRAIRLLRDAGIARMVMVTGDRAAAAQAIGAALDLDAVLADRVPSDKVEAVRTEQRLHPTIMV